jgi:hypothetical protein
LMRKKLKSLVFQGMFDVFARLFLWVSVLIRDDFPTFDLPKKAISGYSGGGHCCKVEAEVMNWADLTIIWFIRGKIAYCNNRERELENNFKFLCKVAKKLNKHKQSKLASKFSSLYFAQCILCKVDILNEIYFSSLNEIFRENLSQRFTNYLCRIWLPDIKE